MAEEGRWGARGVGIQLRKWHAVVVTGIRKRTIRVDGGTYLWVVRQTAPHEVAVRVWRQDGARRCGGALEVAVSFIGNPWYFVREPERLNAQNIRHAVHPSLVERLIRDGLTAGWRPDADGPAARFVLDGSRTRLEPVEPNAP